MCSESPKVSREQIPNNDGRKNISQFKILKIFIGTPDGSKPNGISTSLKEGMDMVLTLIGPKAG